MFGEAPGSGAADVTSDLDIIAIGIEDGAASEEVGDQRGGVKGIAGGPAQTAAIEEKIPRAEAGSAGKLDQATGQRDIAGEIICAQQRQETGAGLGQAASAADHTTKRDAVGFRRSIDHNVGGQRDRRGDGVDTRTIQDRGIAPTIIEDQRTASTLRDGVTVRSTQEGDCADGS